MEPAFWRTAWHDGRTAFHEGTPNSYLARHHDWLAGCSRILVPLCGKTEDLAYLAGQGHEVLGIELVEDAVKQFFAAHEVTPEVTRDGELAIYRSGTICVIAGDFFAVTLELVRSLGADITGVFDRAALVALPPAMRDRYVDQIGALAPKVRRALLVSIEYPAGTYEGPPFCVDETEVRRLFAGATIEFVGENSYAPERAGGKMIERCYTIAR